MSVVAQRVYWDKYIAIFINLLVMRTLSMEGVVCEPTEEEIPDLRQAYDILSYEDDSACNGAARKMQMNPIK